MSNEVNVDRLNDMLEVLIRWRKKAVRLIYIIGIETLIVGQFVALVDGLRLTLCLVVLNYKR